MNLLDKMASHIREFQISGEGMGELYRDLEAYDRLRGMTDAVATLTVSPSWGPAISIDAENAIAKLPPGEYPLYTRAQDAAGKGVDAEFSSNPMFAFLLGEGELNGYWFGDKRPDRKGAFWWREELRALLTIYSSLAKPAQVGQKDAIGAACCAYSIALANTGSNLSAIHTPHERAMTAAIEVYERERARGAVVPAQDGGV